MREMFDCPAEDCVIAQAIHEQPGGLPASVVDPPRISPSSTPSHCHPAPLSDPERQCTESAVVSPSLVSHDNAYGTHIADECRQRCADASSSGDKSLARNITPFLPVPPLQSDQREETSEAPNTTTSNVTLHSKILEIFEPHAPPSRSSVIRPPMPASSSSKGKAARGKAAAAPKAKAVPAKKTGEKQKRELLTPLEYAQRLNDRMANVAATNKSRAKPYLRGMHIFYYGADMNYASEETTGHMDHVRCFL